MQLFRKVTNGAEKMAKMSAQAFKSQKYTFSNMLDSQVRILLEEDAEGMLQAAKEDLDTGIPVVGKRREEHARRIREQYKMIVETTRPFLEVSLLPEQFKTVTMRSPMVRLTVGICLPEGVLLVVMIKQKLTPSELAFTINSGYLRTPSSKKVRADTLEEAVISFGMPVGFAREVLLDEVTRSEESGVLGPTPGVTPRPSVPDVQAPHRPLQPVPADRGAAEQERQAILQGQSQRPASRPGPANDRAPSAADQEWEAFLQQQVQSQRSALRPTTAGGAPSAADQEWAALMQQEAQRPSQTAVSAADREWEALFKQQAPAQAQHDDWDAFLHQELQKQRESRVPAADHQVPCSSAGACARDCRQCPTPSQPSQRRRPCSAQTSFARQPPPWQQGVNLAETQARAAAPATQAARQAPTASSLGQDPRPLPSRTNWQEDNTLHTSPTLSAPDAQSGMRWHMPASTGTAGSANGPWQGQVRQRTPELLAAEPAEPPPLPAPATPPWPGTEEPPPWPSRDARRGPEPGPAQTARQQPLQAAQALVVGKAAARSEDDRSAMQRPAAAPVADAAAGGMPRGFIPVEGQVEFFSQSMQRYVPALLVGLAVEATSVGPPGSLFVAPAGCAEQVLHPSSFRKTLRFPS